MRQWSAQDPGAGSPDDVRAAAARSVSEAGTLRSVAEELAAHGRGLAAGWVGASADAISGTVSAYTAELRTLAEQSEADAGALHRYAGEVAAIAQQASTLVAERGEAQLRLGSARSGLSFGQDPSSVQALVGQLTGELHRLDARLAILAQQRALADNAAVAALTGPQSRGALAGIPGTTAPAGHRTSAVPSLAQLAGLSERELAVLFSLHPDLADRYQEHPPEEVAAWWTGLSADAQAALVIGAPTLIGALGGVSTLARVAANRLNAHTERTRLRSRIDHLQNRIAILAGEPGHIHELERRRAELTDLTNADSYLAHVTDGTRTLYLYQPDKDRIVEMIGTPTATTTDVITYVPGNGTNLNDFYRGGVQQVADWLNRNNPDAIAFVWKGADFPGQDAKTVGPSELVEANKPGLAIRTGAALADFGDQLRTDSRLATAASSGIAHSWGLAAVTGSEVAGARYDNVFSLSGAWMPPGWEANSKTDYFHFTYTDFLTVAKDLGLVGGGHIPDTDPAFETPLGKRLANDGDFTLYPPDPTGGTVPPPNQPEGLKLNWNLDDPHSRIASNDAANNRVLRRIERELQAHED